MGFRMEPVKKCDPTVEIFCGPTRKTAQLIVSPVWCSATYPRDWVKNAGTAVLGSHKLRIQFRNIGVQQRSEGLKMERSPANTSEVLGVFIRNSPIGCSCPEEHAREIRSEWGVIN